MDMLDLPTDGSLCPDGLPFAWDPEKMLQDAEQVFCASCGNDDAIETTMASNTGSPYSNSPNAQAQVGSWPMQALKCNDASSDTSSLQSMVLHHSWAPPAHSNSSASSGLGTEVCSQAPQDCAAAPVVPRVVRRTRARRGTPHPADAAAQRAQEQVEVEEQEAPLPVRKQRKPRPQPQTREKPPSYERPAWAVNVGPTLSGVLRPFEAVKGYGAATDSRTLQAVNDRLRQWQSV